MVDFIVNPTEVILRYEAELRDNGWVWSELTKHGYVTLSRIFNFERRDLVAEPDEADADNEFEDFTYDFRFASRSDGYFHIDGRIFDISNPVLIADQGLRLRRKVFAAERDISVFRRIAKLIPPDQEIVVGGDRAGAIPIEDFETLIRKFPNTTELNRYAAARVSMVIGDYLAPLKDAREQYEAYLTRTRSTLKGEPLGQPELLRTELEKYVLIRDTIVAWLKEADSRSEDDWQKMILTFLLLIFPKYVAVLEKVRIADVYSTPDSTRDRFIDLALVDASGNIDVIEIKKPFENALLRRTPYRDNSIPAKELAGSIMQAEKYLFHLSKWGLAGEKALTKRYADQLPPDLSIRVTNPKAMIIVGRDRRADGAPALNTNQALDLEIIKRQYANMIDIMTYDDLLRRLDNIIASLERRAKEGLADAALMK